MLLWLWCRLAAVAPIQPLAPLCSPKKTKKKKKAEWEQVHNGCVYLCISESVCLTYVSLATSVTVFSWLPVDAGCVSVCLLCV